MRTRRLRREAALDFGIQQQTRTPAYEDWAGVVGAEGSGVTLASVGGAVAPLAQQRSCISRTWFWKRHSSSLIARMIDGAPARYV